MVALYLAGPEVFLTQAQAVGVAKRQLCAAYGHEGLYPLDSAMSAVSGEDVAARIYRANIDMIRKSAALVANLTPFRGPSADAGTIFEIGYALALVKPVFAYVNVIADYRERVIESHGPVVITSAGAWARDGMAVENFGLRDNLMIAESIAAQGWDIVAHAAPPEALFTDLKAFELCLRRVSAHFSG